MLSFAGASDSWTWLLVVGGPEIQLTSYRFAWAERAYTVEMPERLAMANLGHASKAMHRHYAKKAHVIVPTLESFEKAAPAVCHRKASGSGETCPPSETGGFRSFDTSLRPDKT